MFDEASDEASLAGEELKSPSKMKKGKAFRFGPKKDKEEKKDKEGRKEHKEKTKDDKEKKIHMLRVKKKSKHHKIHQPAVPTSFEKPVFGVPLSVAVERSKCHDGIQLPALFRECVDYIEEHGLHCEGIYRISGVKSKVQHLKDAYNAGGPVYLEEHEPNIVAGVLKQFLRELPEPVLTNALVPKFEEASTFRNDKKRVESFKKLIEELPECNRLLLSWMIVHMTHVIERQKENKMTLQNVSIVLSPTMQISHRVLNVLFLHTKQIFENVVIKRYIPPLKPATSKWSLELPDNPAALEEELSKQESLLNQLHEELAGKADPEKEEQIWEVQRVCTQLKRKIKLARKNQDNLEKRKRERDEMSKRNTVLEEEEELNLELRALPDDEVLNLALREPPKEAVQPTTGEEEESEEPPKDTTEVKDEIDTESQKEAETKSKEKVTLKELADQSKAVKTQKDEVSIEKEGQSDQSETVVVEKEVVEAAGDSTEKVVSGDGEIAEEISETAEEAAEEEETVVTEDKSNEPESEVITVSAEKEEVVAEAEVDDKKSEEKEEITAEDVKADLKKKQAMMLQEDTTDSELGRSTEDIQNKVISSEDEFENSVDEILEREDAIESDRDGTDQETLESKETEEESLDESEKLPVETKTPVPLETPESPQSVTPIPEITEEPQEVKEPVEPSPDEVVEEFLQNRKPVEEPDEPVPREKTEEEEYQELLDEEYSLKLKEEELLAIESELRKKIETERCEMDRLKQEIQELQYLRHDSDPEYMSSSSDSSYESEDEEDLQEMLANLIKENEELENKNSELCQKIHEERMICLGVKVQIGLIQHKQMQASAGQEKELIDLFAD